MARGGTTRIAGIVVDFVANTLGYDASLKKSGDVTSRWSRGVEQSFSRASKKIDGFVSSAFSMRNVVGALVGGGGLGYLAKQGIDTADQLGETAEKLGLTTEFLQEMTWAAKLAGVESDSMARSLGLLNKTIAQAAAGNDAAQKKFRDLGVEVTNADGSIRSAKDIFLDIAAVFPRLQEGAARTGVAVGLFGKSGQELVPLLSRGSEAIAGMTEQAHRLGMVVSGDATQAAGALNDVYDAFFASMRSAIAEGVIEGVASQFTDVNNALADSEGAIDAAHDALKEFVSTIVANASDIAILMAAVYGYRKGGVPGALFGGAAAMTAREAARDRVKVGERDRRLATAGTLDAPELAAAVEQMRLAAAQQDRLTISTEKATKAKAAAKTEQEKHDEAVEKFTASLALEVRALEIEAAAIGLGEEARREALIQRDLEVALAKEGIAAGTEEARVIEELIRKRSALNAEIDATKTATEEATDAGERFTSAYEATGQTIGTAFEDAIIEGEKLGDVLESLLKDLQRIALRTLITGPLETALAGTLKDIIPFGKTAALTGVAAPEMAAPQVNVYTQPGETARVSSRQGTGGSQLDIVIEAVESRLAQRTVTGRGIRAPLAVLMRGPEG